MSTLASTNQLFSRILSKMDEHPDLYYKAPRGRQKHKLDERDMRQAEQMINLGQAGQARNLSSL